MSLLKACNGGSVVDPPVDLTEDLVSHYLLNNNADDSHGSYDGTPSSGVDFQGDVTSFDGVAGSKVSCGSINLSANFSISVWVSLDEIITANSYNILGKANPSSNGYMLYLDATQNYQFYGYGLSTPKIETISGQTTDFVHLVITYDGSNLKMYFNGTLEATVPSLGTITSNTDELELGFYKASVNNYLAMKLSNLRIYNTAKDQVFITALYEEGYYPKPLPLPTTNGLTAHYPLTGTAEDATGNYDGTEVGNTYVNDAEFGSVASFDGVDDYVVAPLSASPDANEEKTLSMWVKPDGTSLYGGVIATRDILAGGEGYFLICRATSPNISYGHTSNGALQASTSGITVGEWFHVVLSIEANNINGKIYVNSIPQTITLDTLTSPTNGTEGFYIGRQGGGFSDGKMSDIRTYNRVLTQQEITDIYNYEKNFRPIDIDDGLVAYYPLANNSLDNYYNEYDGVDSDMTYDGLSGVFNGVSSNVSLGNLTSMTLNSISFIVNIKSDKVHSILSQRVYFGHQLIIGIREGGFVNVYHTEYLNFTEEVTFTTALNIDTIYHIAIVYDGTNLNLFINGELAESIALANSLYIGNTTPTFLGYGHYDVASLWKTYADIDLSKLRIYNKAITAEQVKEIYNTEKGDFI